ncbi:hypothetical protein GCM10009795_024040 [Nocardioides hankookensis]
MAPRRRSSKDSRGCVGPRTPSSDTPEPRRHRRDEHEAEPAQGRLEHRLGHPVDQLGGQREQDQARGQPLLGGRVSPKHPPGGHPCEHEDEEGQDDPDQPDLR